MSKITKFSYNNQSQSFTDRETLECDCCIIAGTPEWKGKTVNYYVDDAQEGPQLRQLKFDKTGQAKATIQPNGGIILTDMAP